MWASGVRVPPGPPAPPYGALHGSRRRIAPAPGHQFCEVVTLVVVFSTVLDFGAVDLRTTRRRTVGAEDDACCFTVSVVTVVVGVGAATTTGGAARAAAASAAADAAACCAASARSL